MAGFTISVSSDRINSLNLLQSDFGVVNLSHLVVLFLSLHSEFVYSNDSLSSGVNLGLSAGSTFFDTHLRHAS